MMKIETERNIKRKRETESVIARNQQLRKKERAKWVEEWSQSEIYREKLTVTENESQSKSYDLKRKKKKNRVWEFN